MKPKGWGFDTAELNKKVRPQDDFFAHVNSVWIKNNPIPDDESRWGAFFELRYETDKQIKTLLEEVAVKKHVVHGSEQQIIRDFYRSGLAMKERNRLGAAPLGPLRKKICKIDSLDTLVEVIALFTKKGVTTPWDMDVDQDFKKSDTNVVYIAQDGLGMPDRDYYLKSDKETLRVRNAYTKHIVNVLKLIGHPTKEAVRRMEGILRLETALARASMSRVAMRDPYKLYHKKTRSELKKLTPRVKWNRYFKAVGAQHFTSLIVMQPLFFKALNTLLKTVPLPEWKIYLEWHLTNDLAPFLSQAFVNENFAFYGVVLSGNKKIQPLWRRVTKVVEGSVGEALGKLYVKKYFLEDAKRKMNELIDDLFTTFEMRLKKLEWMSPATKKKALTKLGAMNKKVGYPDRWRSYKGLSIAPDDYVGNVLRSAEYEHRRSMRKLGKPVDPYEWHMYPQTVNAYYSPTRNEIVFPAAILQYPFFDKHADDAMNYGGIGSTIGHEMTHGFDDEGSKFDGKGNLKSWWSAADRKRFEGRARILEKQFNRYSVAPGVHVNGKLTLGENIADLGGVAIAFDAYKKHLAKRPSAILSGFSPEQRFFIGHALTWREHFRLEYIKQMVRTNTHSPDMFRTNGPLSNLEPFYEAFDVKKGDKLYRAPKDRANIW